MAVTANPNWALPLVAVLVPASAVLVLISAVAFINNVPLTLVVDDPAAVARLHPLTGIQSSLGILLWCVAGTLCLFTALALGNRLPSACHLFLMCSATLNAYLLMDDLFQFHEKLAIAYLGVRQKYVLAMLAIAVGAYLVAFWRVIAETRYALLVAAVLLLSVSVVVDTVVLKLVPEFGELGLFVEEASKWLGIASWCGYFTLVSSRWIAEALQPSPATPASTRP